MAPPTNGQRGPRVPNVDEEEGEGTFYLRTPVATAAELGPGPGHGVFLILLWALGKRRAMDSSSSNVLLGILIDRLRAKKGC